MDNSLRDRILELTGSVRIRPARPTAEDAQAFADLLNSQYARKIAPPYYFWQFFCAPAPSICLFAEADGQLVGTYGLRTLRQIGSGEHRVGLCVDMMVSPRYRGAGLYMRLEEEMESQARKLGCVGLYAAANREAHRPRVTALGWSSLRQIDMATIATSKLGLLDAKASVKVTRTERFGEETDGIVKDFQAWHPTVIFSTRTAEYLNWRFIDNPRYAYEVFVARRGTLAIAYLVLKVFVEPESGTSCGDIVDLVWGEDDSELLEQILRFAVAHFAARGVKRVAAYFQTTTILDDIGRALGFSASGNPRYLCGKALDSHSEWLQAADRWFVVMTDSEVF